MSTTQPHRRYNPLKDEWIIVAPQRVQRPWAGAVEPPAEDQPSQKGNTLWPGATRSTGKVNDNYTSTYVFTNDFPALLPDTLPAKQDEPDKHELFRSQPVVGTCRVMCFHPRSDLTLATMELVDVRKVVDCWIEQLTELGRTYDWVQLFENKGAIVGCSNPHPHCQIWTGNFLPNEPSTKHRTQREYLEKRDRPLLMDYLAEELIRRERLVYENEHWAVLVPYWAVWPYETMLLPKRHVLRLNDLVEAERATLCDAMQALLVRYDNLFKCSFPYSMGWHGAPTGVYSDQDCSHWQLHAVYLPPLLRSATVKKFMAGYELVCEPQRDLTPEAAAATLRDLPSVHYKKESAQQ